MDPATSMGGRTKRVRRDEATEEGHSVPPNLRMPREASAGPARPEVGAAAVSGMKGVAVNATMSFAAPLTEEHVRRGVVARPKTDVIARIKSNTKTHRGTPRPLGTEERHITGEYEKPNETAASQQRPLDPDTIQELSAVGPDEIASWGAAAAPRTRSFASAQIRPPSQPLRRPPSQPAPHPDETAEALPSRRTPLQRAPDALLRPTAREPLAERILDAPRLADPPVRWPVTAIVVSTLVIALLGGLIAMATTGG